MDVGDIWGGKEVAPEALELTSFCADFTKYIDYLKRSGTFKAESVLVTLMIFLSLPYHFVDGCSEDLIPKGNVLIKLYCPDVF